MVISKTKQFSTDEILELGASFIAGTIHPKKMNLDINDESSDVFFETFKKSFKEKAAEMLEKKPALTLTIGPSINTDNGGIYSNDMIEILSHIEKEVHQKCYFYYGAIVLLCEKEYFSFWQPQ